jgi:hypothetical protein
MSRRAFVVGAISTPVILNADLFPLAEPANTAVKQIAVKPKTLFALWDSNMAMQSWQWDFVLENAPDGSFTLSANQIFEYADEEDEPWELDPVSALRTGDDIYSALSGMLNEVGYPADDLEEASDVLAQFDPKLADEFRSVEAEYHG